MGLSFPIESPFFPQISDDSTVKLNKGYVIDYYTKGENNSIKMVAVEGTGDTSSHSTGKLYLKINYNGDTFAVESASVSSEPAAADVENVICMLVCETDSKGIKEIYVRENIHWMMIPKPKDKTKSGVVVFNVELGEGQTASPGGAGRVKWLQFQTDSDETPEVIGGIKSKAKLIPTAKCPPTSGT